jgi:rhodanese-related sulfurtransferase
MTTATAAPVSFPQTVSPRTAADLLAAGSATLVDVREPDEHRREHVAGAALHPSSAFSVTGFPASTDRCTLVLCRSGNRAGKVAAALREAGRTDISVVEGGLTGWQAAGLPVVRDARAPLPIVRQVMIAAGTLIVTFTVLAAFVNPWFLAGTAFMGAGLAFAGLTGICGMATVLARMPWNRASKRPTAANTTSNTCSSSCCN